MPLAGLELTPLQVMKLCYKHGLDPDAGHGLCIVNAVCVCFGESSFFTGAWNFNDKTGDKSYGLWQINMIEPLGAARRTKYDIKDNRALYDPDLNCKVMMDMSAKGTNFKPWGAFTNGSYRAALGVAVTARASLLQSLGRSVSDVPVPVETLKLPLSQRPWVSFKQIKKAALSSDGLYMTPGGDSSRDDVSKYQRALWKLLPDLTYLYTPGRYDKKTKWATTAFQKKQGWSGSEADGIVGPDTIKMVAAKSEMFRVRDW